MLIMADASPRMGTGHVMRCIALAQAALKTGMNCAILCRSTVEWLNGRLRGLPIPIHIITEEPPASKNPQECLAEISQHASRGDSWIVLDGYHFTLECQTAIRRAGRRLLVIDDYMHLARYDCDLLLNQNVCAQELPYGGDIGKRLLGPCYALLRQEFVKARENARRDIEAPPKNILINLGGGNFIDVLAELAYSLGLKSKVGLKIKIIRGSMPIEKIKGIFAGSASPVEILENVENMAKLLLKTDLCVTAGGSTCWELCCLGVPFLTVEIAENQRQLIKHLQAAYGIRPATRARFDFMLADREALKAAKNVEMKMVDGMGAERVIKEVFK